MVLTAVPVSKWRFKVFQHESPKPASRRNCRAMERNFDRGRRLNRVAICHNTPKRILLSSLRIPGHMQCVCHYCVIRLEQFSIKRLRAETADKTSAPAGEF